MLVRELPKNKPQMLPLIFSRRRKNVADYDQKKEAVFYSLKASVFFTLGIERESLETTRWRHCDGFESLVCHWETQEDIFDTFFWSSTFSWNFCGDGGFRKWSFDGVGTSNVTEVSAA